MDYLAINNKINKIQSCGIYNSNQIEALKYAIYRSDINEDLFLDPNNVIPADYIYMYIKLLARKKNIEFYVKNRWHDLGFDPSQSEILIYGHLGGVNIGDITINMTASEIYKIIHDRIRSKQIEKDNPNLFKTLKNIGFSLDVINFFITKFNTDPGVSYLFEEKYTVFSLEQIKYLYTVMSTGVSIDNISNPYLSVADMKQIILNSEESRSFLNDIRAKRG